MTKVVNFYGGPGVGKSTNATGLFNRLKRAGVSCEYINEYAKELTWENNTHLLECQPHLFGEQFRRQWRLKGKVDYIITDSPLLLCLVYTDYYVNKLGSVLPQDYLDKSMAYHRAAFDLFDNINVKLLRTKQYDPNGRNQTLEEAEALDALVDKYVGTYDIVSNSYHGDQDAYKHIRGLLAPDES